MNPKALIFLLSEHEVVEDGNLASIIMVNQLVTDDHLGIAVSINTLLDGKDRMQGVKIRDDYE